MQILHQLKAILTNLLAGQQGISHEQLESVSFALATDPQKQQFGDISTNAALILAPLKGMAPRAVAEELRTELRAAITEELVARIEIAGPGFINLFLAPQAFQAMAEELLTQGAAAFAKPAGESTKHYVVEFVSANPTGPMHLGHGRNGIIGDVLTRILRLRGHQVTAEFYINDAGSQIKKLG